MSTTSSKPSAVSRQRMLLNEKTGFFVQEAFKSLRTNIMNYVTKY